ncbi:MAG: hypothetical protein KAV45_12455 [Calditrichia bacterium]|nr:hypothetical protein [Calditrichia bacterium]
MLKTVKFSVLIFIFTIITFVAGADKTGYLSVSVEDGKQIYVDTTFVGRHSFSYMELPVGEYTIHVYNSQTYDWADRGISKDIVIEENAYVNLDFVLTDQVKVLSLPIGGKVFAGDELIGNTPITFNRDLVGTQTIKIEKKGYAEQSFNLDANQNEYSFNLLPLENDIQLKVARISNSQNQLKWYREGLVVTSLIASWASFYYKRQADQTYAKYQVTSDSRQRFALWRQTRQYDTYAEIAIGVSVATLGTYFFLLLID